MTRRTSLWIDADDAKAAAVVRACYGIETDAAALRLALRIVAAARRVRVAAAAPAVPAARRLITLSIDEADEAAAAKVRGLYHLPTNTAAFRLALRIVVSARRLDVVPAGPVKLPAESKHARRSPKRPASE